MLNTLYDLNGLNKDFFIIINKYTNKSIIPNILNFISSLFSMQIVSVYYVIAILGLLLYLRKSSLKHFWSLYNYAIKISIIYAGILGLYTILKYTVNMPRPFCSLKVGQFKTICDLDGVRCLSSFPSAHTALAVFITYILWPWLSKRRKALALFVVILVGISRIALGMHYPSDIIYSIPIVFFIIFLGNSIFLLFKNNLIRKIGYIALKFLKDQ